MLIPSHIPMRILNLHDSSQAAVPPVTHTSGRARQFTRASIARVVLLAAALQLYGCALVQSPTERVEALAAQAGMQELSTGDKRLRGFLRPGSGTLTVYIESDGAPWPAPNQPPYDPTPIKPVVMQMAVADKTQAVGYLGRPCQYLDAQTLDDCDPALWTLGRFSESAVAASANAVEQMKRRSGAARVQLVGYSGGGAMAALVAARRSDVACLVTLASPLDIDGWADAIDVTRLRQSLNPLAYAASLANVPQTHFAGARDVTVPPASARRYFSAVPKARVVTLDNYSHTCCWADEWAQLLARSCLAAQR